MNSGPTSDDLFAVHPDGAAVPAAVRRLVAELGHSEERVGRSQVAFRRRRGFAYVWRPGQYVRIDVPAEVLSPDELDEQVRGWLAEAYDAAADHSWRGRRH